MGINKEITTVKKSANKLDLSIPLLGVSGANVNATPQWLITLRELSQGRNKTEVNEYVSNVTC